MNTSSLSDIYLHNFFQTYLPFYLVNWKRKSLNFHITQFTKWFFFLCFILFVPWEIFLITRWKKFSTIFTTGSFILLALNLDWWSVLSLLYVWCEVRSMFIYLHRDIQLFWHHLLERVFFPFDLSSHICQNAIEHTCEFISNLSIPFHWAI